MSTKPTSAKGLFLKLNPAQRLETIYDTLEDIVRTLSEHSSLLSKVYSEVQQVDFSESDQEDLDGLQASIQEDQEEVPLPPSKKVKIREIQVPTNLAQEMETDPVLPKKKKN